MLTQIAGALPQDLAVVGRSHSRQACSWSLLGGVALPAMPPRESSSGERAAGRREDALPDAFPREKEKQSVETAAAKPAPSSLARK